MRWNREKKILFLKRIPLKRGEFMSSMIINIKSTRKCAICKNWYDPTNSAIEPKSPRIGVWKIKDTNQKSICLKRNYNMQAGAFCSSDFECKL